MTALATDEGLASVGDDTTGGSRVGIVLVSHSPRLAAAVAELVSSLGAGEAVVVTAGGANDGQFGTSDELVAEAIRAADRGVGVVVIPDLGSSVLTTKRLLLDDERHLPAQVRIADAPFVEGAVAAASVASVGVNCDVVLAAAEEAKRIPKV